MSTENLIIIIFRAKKLVGYYSTSDGTLYVVAIHRSIIPTKNFKVLDSQEYASADVSFHLTNDRQFNL